MGGGTYLFISPRCLINSVYHDDHCYQRSANRKHCLILRRGGGASRWRHLQGGTAAEMCIDEEFFRAARTTMANWQRLSLRQTCNRQGYDSHSLSFAAHATLALLRQWFPPFFISPPFSSRLCVRRGITIPKTFTPALCGPKYPVGSQLQEINKIN